MSVRAFAPLDSTAMAGMHLDVRLCEKTGRVGGWRVYGFALDFDECPEGLNSPTQPERTPDRNASAATMPACGALDAF
ncbi:MAG: hypothetical protein WDW36_010160 [Sanguina aurantia]